MTNPFIKSVTLAWKPFLFNLPSSSGQLGLRGCKLQILMMSRILSIPNPWRNHHHNRDIGNFPSASNVCWKRIRDLHTLHQQTWVNMVGFCLLQMMKLLPKPTRNHLSLHQTVLDFKACAVGETKVKKIELLMNDLGITCRP